jgi:Fic family protein
VGTGLANPNRGSTAISNDKSARMDRLHAKKRRSEMTVLDVTTRCRGEFLDMPGMRLTLPQAARFLGIDIDTCERALESLVNSGFLRKSGSAYMRNEAVTD